MHATRCQVSDVASIDDASLSYSSLTGWVEAGRASEFVDLMRAVWRSRAYGDFWSYMLLAEGGVDIACEPSWRCYDMAACADRGHRGGWPVHRPGRHARPARARTPSPPTAGCTTSSWRSSRVADAGRRPSGPRSGLGPGAERQGRMTPCS